MELQLFGINYKTSNVAEREQFIINESNQIILDNHLKSLFKNDLESFYGISTCNRTEIYMVGRPGISKEVFKEVANTLKLDEISEESFYFLENHDALVHMVKVASGIDSQVLGEQEIFGQFKAALKRARVHKIIGNKLSFLSDKVIEISKQARTETEIGLNSLSISGLALRLIRNIFEEPENQNVLILGAGSLAQNVMENMHSKGISNIKAVNRTPKKIKLNNNFEILSSSLDSLHDELETADIVVASSITEIPLIGKGAIENALKKRKYRPMLLIDLGVPRNIEDEIKHIEQAYLFSIDDIEKITQENFGQRVIEAEKALNMIVIDSQQAITEMSNKSLKDGIKDKLEKFLNSLSNEEIERFKSAEDLKQMMTNLAIIKSEDNSLEVIPEIENIDAHIIESMFKRYIENA